MPFKRRLILVSNREPYSFKKGKVELSAGGLVTALDPVMQRTRGIWVAWGSGEKERDRAGKAEKVRVPPQKPAYTVKRVWLSHKQLENYYHGYSNRFLWPLCHIVLDRVYLKRAYWNDYKKVNRIFADAIVEEVRSKKAVVWLQDYHLAVCARYIKEKKPWLATTIFWHIPWPPYDVFRVCPQRREILEGMLANDLIGFQLDSFSRHFMDCASIELGADIGLREGVIYYKGHVTKVRDFPISVNFNWFEKCALSKRIKKFLEGIRKTRNLPADGKIGLGVDRLDYTKGLMKRLEIMDLFFSKYPRFRKKFTFIQVAVPTRKVEPFLSYRNRVEKRIDYINRKHGRQEWVPIIYIETKLDQKKLAMLYRIADIALISSVYDGMNLVAKEFIASQVDEDGVLLLSEFAGAAEEIPGATLINPYDIEGCADILRSALERPLEDRRHDMHMARNFVRGNDIFKWVDNILAEMETI